MFKNRLAALDRPHGQFTADVSQIAIFPLFLLLRITITMNDKTTRGDKGWPFGEFGRRN